MNIRPVRRMGVANSNFDDFYNMIDSFFKDEYSQRAMTSSTFKVDISESEDSYLVEAELPGFNKDEVEILLEDGKLQITAHRDEESKDESKNYIHRERKSEEISRTMFFKDIDEDGLKASLKDGVLEISIPKQKEVETKKKIEIE